MTTLKHCSVCGRSFVTDAEFCVCSAYFIPKPQADTKAETIARIYSPGEMKVAKAG
jgi:predicted nucleic acid-binding Zn ribbon protein